MTMYERRFQEINMELEKLPLLFDMTDEQHARFEQLCEELFAVVPHIGTTNTQEQVERNAANARFADDYERSIDYELSFQASSLESKFVLLYSAGIESIEVEEILPNDRHYIPKYNT